MTKKLSGPTYTLWARSFLVDPSAQELQALTASMPTSRWTKYKNLNVSTRVQARRARSTFLVGDNPELTAGKLTISRTEYDRLVGLQDNYIRNQDMVVINGYIGNDRHFRVPARLVVEASHANIAASQRLLYFDPDEEFVDPIITVIYTPNLEAKGYPNDCCMAVDLEAGLARNFNSDYFGESKKGGLRIWNKIVYDRGGLALHAGCKVLPTESGNKTLLITGLSGTGKTTTTFVRQNDSKPVQDDFVAIMPGGKVYGSEDGCFAKTYGLAYDSEPTIYSAVTEAGAYLENVSQTEDGSLDFFDESFTRNGRAVFAMEKLGWYEDARNIEPASCLLILNRNTSIIPAIARLPKASAAAYFMLGETQGTAAGGVEEAGKSLRIPGTNPFFPLPDALQGNRFYEILSSTPMDVYLMNTGWIGGGEEDVASGRSKKIRVATSSALIKGIADGSIQWQSDPDFGYEVASLVPGIDDTEYLQPRQLYERQNRLEEYERAVRVLKQARLEYLSAFANLNPQIIAAVG